jgi:PHS family inorganic phosphate transporter-like MFS transporter
LILAAAGLIPGYWVTFLFVDSWGRKPIQLMGFIILTILFVIMGFAYDKLTATAATTNVFVFLYCLANFFQNFGTSPSPSPSFKPPYGTSLLTVLTHPIGPNTTTFIIPGEVFPTRYRSTSHGISAASGKLGAIVAQVGFAQLKDIGGTNKFVKHILEIFALFMLTGIFSTLLLPETKGRTLEELSNEDQQDFVKGVAKSEVKKAPKLITHS